VRITEISLIKWGVQMSLTLKRFGIDIFITWFNKKITSFKDMPVASHLTATGLTSA